MARNITRITGGPAQVKMDDDDVSHTQGGVTVNISPQNRNRWVDQFGEGSVLSVIHTGDDIRATVPWAQWDGAVLSHIYAPGLDATSSSAGGLEFLGLGRYAGYTYVPMDMKIIPFAAADDSKFAHFFKVVPMGEFSFTFTADEDRIIEVEYTALIDQSKSDGMLIGRLYVGAE